MIVQAKSLDLGVLNSRLAEADYVAAHTVTSQVSQQRQGSWKQREFADGTIKVSLAGSVADGFGVSSVKTPADFAVDVTEHGVLAECAHASTVGGFYRGLEAGSDHGSRRVTMRHPHALPEAVVEGVVEIEDDRTDERLGGRPILALRLSFSLGLTHAVAGIAIVIAATIESMEDKLLLISRPVSVLDSIPVLCFPIRLCDGEAA
jgi:hypothetical protein